MDFEFAEEQERLRKEIHDFYISELPEDFEPVMYDVSEKAQSFYLELQRRAGERGYLSAGWAKEYGGLGFTSIEQGIVAEEPGYWEIRWPNSLGLRICAPALIAFGTEEQKRKFIPPLARGEVVWFELLTEPEAGSDEANVQLRAVEDGDDYILNGQKTFISGACKPDYLFTLVRTASTIPKHRGLSLFLVPADTPGITYRPLPTMGFGIQNEIFFDDVRLSKEYLLGELNRGFYHTMTALEFERGGTARATGSKHRLDEFVQFCKGEKRNGKPLVKDPEVRRALAQMAVELEVWHLIGWHAQWWHDQREKLGSKPYDLTGFWGKVLTPKHSEAMMKILNVYGQLRKGSKWTKLAGRIEKLWQESRSLHAEGTLEIQKVVIAQRGLGLPRPPRPATASAKA
ncbi:acyl-CoA dehydrogenase family protein [Chloroflexota bacterium]